jgi:hypothetical protein
MSTLRMLRGHRLNKTRSRCRFPPDMNSPLLLVTAAALGSLASCAGPGMSTGGSYASYENILIEPVATSIGTSDASPVVAEQLAATYQSELRSAFGKRLWLVGEAGPNTLRVRATLSAPSPAPASTTHASPKERLQGPLGPAASLVSSVSFSGEILSPSGRRLASTSDPAIGKLAPIDASTDWVAIHIPAEKSTSRLASALATPAATASP